MTPTTDRSQIDMIEVPLEPLVAQCKTLSGALAPVEPHDFDWEPPQSHILTQASDD